MRESFDIKFGLEGLQRKLRTSSVVVGATASRAEDDHSKVVANSDAEIKTLNGIWWQEFNRSKTLKLVLLNRNPFLAARFFAGAVYSPPVAVSIGVTLSARFVSSGYCARRPSLLETHFTIMRTWRTFSPLKKTRICVFGKASFHTVMGHARCCRNHNSHGELEYELIASAALEAADIDMSGDIVPMAHTMGLGGVSSVAAMLTGGAAKHLGSSDAASQLAALHQGMQTNMQRIASVGLIAKDMFAPVMELEHTKIDSPHWPVQSFLESMEEIAKHNPKKFGGNFDFRGGVEVEVEVEKIFSSSEENKTEHAEHAEHATHKSMFVHAVSRASTPELGLIGVGAAASRLSCFASWDVTNVLLER